MVILTWGAYSYACIARYYAFQGEHVKRIQRETVLHISWKNAGSALP
jgi:hypothetical protein